MDDHGERALAAERAARAGAAVAHRAFRTDVAVETKENKTDYVTPADREAQERVVESIREDYPGDAIVGEEDAGDVDVSKAVPGEGPAWIVDPIDGTNNYVSGVRTWATSVAAVVDGETVAAANVSPALGDAYVCGPHGPTLNGDSISVSEREDPETFTVAPTLWWDYDRRDEYADACREVVERFGDMRRYGCAQAELSMVAAGQLEAALTNVTAHPWDSVAGVHLVRRAGGTVTDVRGDPWKPGADGLVASNGTAHDEVLAAARAIGAE